LAVFSAPQPGFSLIPLPDDGRRTTGSREDLEEEAAFQECAGDPGAAGTQGDQGVTVNAFAMSKLSVQIRSSHVRRRKPCGIWWMVSQQ